MGICRTTLYKKSTSTYYSLLYTTTVFHKFKFIVNQICLNSTHVYPADIIAPQRRQRTRHRPKYQTPTTAKPYVFIYVIVLAVRQTIYVFLQFFILTSIALVSKQQISHRLIIVVTKAYSSRNYLPFHTSLSGYSGLYLSRSLLALYFKLLVNAKFLEICQ